MNIQQLKVFNLNFCAKKSSLVESLFNPVEGRTFSGTFKKTGKRIMFYRASGEPWFCLCFHNGGRLFASVTKLPDGRLHYSYLSSNDSKAIGVPDSYKAECEEIARILSIFNV